MADREDDQNEQERNERVVSACESKRVSVEGADREDDQNEQERNERSVRVSEYVRLKGCECGRVRVRVVVNVNPGAYQVCR